MNIAFTNANTPPSGEHEAGALQGRAMWPLSMRWIHPEFRLRKLKMM